MYSVLQHTSRSGSGTGGELCIAEHKVKNKMNPSLKEVPPQNKHISVHVYIAFIFNDSPGCFVFVLITECCILIWIFNLHDIAITQAKIHFD